MTETRRVPSCIAHSSKSFQLSKMAASTHCATQFFLSCSKQQRTWCRRRVLAAEYKSIKFYSFFFPPINQPQVLNFFQKIANDTPRRPAEEFRPISRFCAGGPQFRLGPLRRAASHKNRKATPMTATTITGPEDTQKKMGGENQFRVADFRTAQRTHTKKKLMIRSGSAAGGWHCPHSTAAGAPLSRLASAAFVAKSKKNGSRNLYPADTRALFQTFKLKFLGIKFQ